MSAMMLAASISISLFAAVFYFIVAANLLALLRPPLPARRLPSIYHRINALSRLTLSIALGSTATLPMLCRPFPFTTPPPFEGNQS